MQANTICKSQKRFMLTLLLLITLNLNKDVT
jgi:hypothetical protein